VILERVIATGLLGIVGAANVFGLVANTGNIADNPMDAILQFGSFGVLSVLVLHVFKYTIPRLAKDLKQAREDYKDMLTTAQEVFIEDMRLERASNEHKTEELTKAVQELTRQVQRVVGTSRATNLQGDGQ